jgi:hypothetical protein
MKRVIQTAALFSMLAIVASLAVAQAPQGQGQGGRGFGRGQAGMLLCDILVLNKEKSEKVVAAYAEVSQKVREANSGADFRSMSEEQRTEYFNKTQKETADGLKVALKDVLAEKEIAAIEAFLPKRIFMSDAELRGLRMIDLKDDQREKLQPLAIELGQKMVTRRFGPPQEADPEREKAEKAYQEAKTGFTAKVAAILSEEQNKAWKEEAAKIEKENQAMRERMQQNRPRQ